MRHRVQDKKFNRNTDARKALLTGLLRNLVLQGSIVTTRARAKVLKRLADKTVGTAKVDSVATRRQLHTIFGKRDVVNTLVDRVAPAMSDRKSGFTRITDLGNRRGDNTPMAKIEFMTQAQPRVKTEPKVKEVKEVKEAKPVAKKAPAAKKKPAAKKSK